MGFPSLSPGDTSTPVASPPCPLAIRSGHHWRPAARQVATLRGATRTSSAARGPTAPTAQGTLTSKATRGFQFSFCFALVQSPCRKSYGWRERERERRAWSGWRSQGRRRSRLPLPSTRSPPGTSPWLWEP